jgi:integrase/recombinase XerC
MSPRTVEGYRHDLEMFGRWLDKTRGRENNLLDVLTTELMGYRHELVRIEKRQPATVNRHLQALRRFCQWATQGGLMASDPSIEIKAVRVTRTQQPRGLHDAEAHALFRAAGASGHGLARRNYAIIQLLLQTGLRVGELADLCVSDITLRQRSGVVRVREGKGRKARQVPLNTTARRALASYLKERGTPAQSAPLFVSKRSTPLAVRSLEATVSELARRAKITRLAVSPHTLRHTFALAYLKQNPGKLVELALLLGHDSLDTTAIYTRPSVEALAADLEKSPLNIDD